MLKANLFSAVLIFFNTAFIFSQPSIKAVYSETPPHFDGKLNDEVWNRAALINELYQREPKTGEIVSEKQNSSFCLTGIISMSEYGAVINPGQ